MDAATIDRRRQIGARHRPDSGMPQAEGFVSQNDVDETVAGDGARALSA
ncbi:hypothetical protein [Nonomuraea sp. NPDC050643]